GPHGPRRQLTPSSSGSLHPRFDPLATVNYCSLFPNSRILIPEKEPMQNSRIAALATLLLASGIAGLAADVLTLEDAIQIATQQNRSVRSADLDVDKAQDKLAATRTRQYPGFSFYMLGAQQLRAYDFTLEKGVLGTYDETGPLPNEDVHLKSPLEP